MSLGSAVLLFGWGANIRSNDRIPAALHRVEDAGGQKEAMEVVPRRMSAILFIAPSSDTVLQPTMIKKVQCENSFQELLTYVPQTIFMNETFSS